MELKEKVELLEIELLETKKLLRTVGAVAEPVLKVSEPFISKTLESSVLDFSYDLAASEEPDALEEKMPWDGYVMSAVLNWPDGCNDLAGIRVEVDGKNMIPRNEQWVALNNVNRPLPLVRYVKKGRLIKVYFKNNDSANTHRLTVLVNIFNYFPETSELMRMI